MEKVRSLPLRYTRSGYAVILPGDRPSRVLDGLITTDYPEEFCLSPSFDPPFIAELMAAGFLVMSAKMEKPDGEEAAKGPGGDPSDPSDPSDPPDPPDPADPVDPRDPVREGPLASYILLPKHHRERSVLFFPDLHAGKTLKRLLHRYELRADAEFDRILDRCAEVHGDDWLTLPLRRAIRAVRELKTPGVRPCSFGLYREGVLRAGEFGVASGGVYTSYSGFYDENSAGTAQMILTGLCLRDRGFAFWDLGMPLAYKAGLGGRTLDRKGFTELFRRAAAIVPDF